MLFRKNKPKMSRKEKAAHAVKHGFGLNVHRAGWSLIRLPLDVARQRKATGESPDNLKSLSFDELLQKWEIPRERVPYLQKTLLAETLAFMVLACLGFSSLVYKFFNPDYSLIAVVIGVVIGAASILHAMLRHHWRSILTRQKYRTFREYLSGKEGK